MLRWNPAHLGPDPAGRLPVNVTEQVVTNLTALPRTDHTAVTALPLHLHKGAAYLSCWKISDLSGDTGTLHPSPHTHRRPMFSHGLAYQDELVDAGVDEQPCIQPVLLPPVRAPAPHRTPRLPPRRRSRPHR
ncbi:hypothetical protein ACTOB_003830 [Actinoplanes oblitus]|uniref:Uncharacterized protein n=1 Tax=Actinoplanes oblitus TaxID=3040509 RepID=A0ABY8WQG0_9ACTN|nr:hypothetical protein [Actinoplanes oblitus]WIN00145.1 hypothetical protein ACTOB_003830 [Actinoplanes oblitus]